MARTGDMPERFEASCTVPVDRASLFDYHRAPGALGRLIPPWENVRVVSSDGSLEPGSRVVLELKVGPIPLRWVAVHTAYDPPNGFEDEQLSGPFAHWHHRHRFLTGNHTGNLGGEASVSDPGAAVSTLVDEIDYRLPLGRLGSLLGGNRVRRQLEAMFRYRQQTTRDDLALIDRYRLPPMAVALSGATGLVGEPLGCLLGQAGHRVIRLVRDISQADEGTDSLAISPQREPRPGVASDRDRPPSATSATSGGVRGMPQVAAWHDEAQVNRLDGIDAVIHLAGKSIADNRWSERVKRQIADSRVLPTRQLCESLARLPNPPKTLLCASAIGIYGDRGEEILDESSAAGEDFLAQVATDWERACQPAIDAGIRVAHLRLGIVLSPRGGALAKLLTPTRFGLGGRLGSGRQWWSWIGIDDVISAIYHVLASPAVNGPVNLVAPGETTNAEFTRELGRALHRPTCLPAPAFALRLALGELADPLLLASTRVRPTELLNSGYRFRHPELHGCLAHLLGLSD
ncbi:MAG: TIGR01777 family protein [Planctomycetaceae bacterium]|nr:MAG: TIGR01777 family protein [Planctomycetaceae bacterium]